MNQVVTDSMMKAYNLGYLTVGDLCSLEKISVEHSSRLVNSMGGKLTYRNSSKEYSITIYTVSITRFFKDYMLFNGIKPDNIDHAIRLVIEHEVGHIINLYKGGRGHDRSFKEIVHNCFGHKDWRIK